MKEPAETEFGLPEMGEAYTQQVVLRAEELIGTNVWSGLHVQRLRTWLRGFTTPAEKYLAAHVLDSLVYRSDQQTRAVITQLFHRTIPELLRLAAVELQNDLIASLQGQAEPEIRLVPVIRDEDPPTKSGPEVCRIIKRALHLNAEWFIWPWQVEESLKKGTKIIIFLDDMLGTGNQFVKFLSRTPEVKRPIPPAKATFIYAPLAAHNSGLQSVRENAPWIYVNGAEVLDVGTNVFAAPDNVLIDGKNTGLGLRNFYNAFARDRLLKKPFGYGSLGLTYAFEHGTPNDSLPILWQRTPKFEPLLER